MHLIATHHGHARPHFDPVAQDPEASELENTAVLEETPRRFGKLQRTFGRWGLAWLESIFRCADVLASINAAQTAVAGAAVSTVAHGGHGHE